MSYEQKVSFMNIIRLKAGIERHSAQEDILNLMSGSSLLRKSSEAIIIKPTSVLTQTPTPSEGTRTRSGSYRATEHSHPRRPSTMSIPEDLDSLPVEEELSSPIDPEVPALIKLPSMEDDASNETDLLSYHSSSEIRIDTSQSIPLFEHFLVIGASVDVSSLNTFLLRF